MTTCTEISHLLFVKRREFQISLWQLLLFYISWTGANLFIQQSFSAFPDNGYYNYQSSQNAPYGNYGNANVSAYKGFRPIRSTSPSESSTASSSPCPFNSEEYPGSVDLLISNLDYNISPREWKNILSTTFHPHVKVR